MSIEPTASLDKLIPKTCPACRSTDLEHASKTVTESTYWRCGRCGEIWNIGRRRRDVREWSAPR
jgi:transposase-like protein